MSDQSKSPQARQELVQVSDGMGGYRHEWRDAPVTAKPKGAKGRRAPDPIKANPEASAQQLRQLVELRERLEEQKAGINDDIRDVNNEVKALGYDLKGYNAIIALRKLDPATRSETEAILETYKCALGIE